jgi:hypothetical protein
MADVATRGEQPFFQAIYDLASPPANGLIITCWLNAGYILPPAADFQQMRNKRPQSTLVRARII